MLRRCLILYSGGQKEYHEWNLRELLLQNYEGWRILDNPSYENKLDAYFKDMSGYVRHLDPIIDDPRLTHKQRVCRLYRWALKEIPSYYSWHTTYKFNIAYKVIRKRFEQYRFVTDPAMCDMMVRQTQKYLRENCGEEFFRKNSTSPGSNAYLANGMLHPDHCQVYDHWTQTEVWHYDDLKLDRYPGHFPGYAEAGEMSERYGLPNRNMATEKYLRVIYVVVFAFIMYHMFGFPLFFFDDDDTKWYETLEPSLKYALLAEERRDRVKQSVLHGNWDYIMGHIKPVTGLLRYNYNEIVKQQDEQQQQQQQQQQKEEEEQQQQQKLQESLESERHSQLLETVYI